MDREKRDAIAKAAKKVLDTFALSFPTAERVGRNEPFHAVLYSAFEDKFRERNLDVRTMLQFSSWIQGVNTSMGSFFERVACILSGGKKVAFTTKKKTSLPINKHQVAKIKQIWNNLKSGTARPDVDLEIKEILSAPTTEMEAAADFTADVFIETEDAITAIELKSVRPNKGESAGEKQKILEAKTALHNSFPGKKIQYFIAFPFDPTSPTLTGYNKKRFMEYLIGSGNYFAPEEFMLGGELWDFVSGESNTMEQILEIMAEVVREKP